MAQKKAATLPIDAELAKIALAGETHRLLLHCCCAPCASYVLEYLSPIFDITAFFFNPNIKSRDEYDRRANEFGKLPLAGGYPNNVDLYVCKYEPDVYETAAAPYIGEPEGGLRCRACFDVRLSETAGFAKKHGYDYFVTTLSVSPHKNTAVLNETGERLAAAYGVKYLNSDFKKRDGFKRSIQLSRQYGLYRQSYCGCGTSASDIL